jgi:hypothetical protein
MSERRLRDVSLPPPEHDPDEIRAFARVVHRALRMICAYLERRYSL